MIFAEQRDNLYRDYNNADFNDEYEDGKFNPSTKNDFLTQIEAKRHRLNIDKLLLNNLNDKIKRGLESPDPKVTIDQEDLHDLVVRGVID